MNGPSGIKIKDVVTGIRRFMGGTGDAAHVRPFPGPQAQSRNRNLVSVADATTGIPATNTVTWDPALNVTELVIHATMAGAGSDDAFVGVTFNATSDAAAKANLNLGLDSATIQAEWYKIPINVPTVFRFTGPVSRADFAVQSNGYTAGSADIWIGAN